MSEGGLGVDQVITTGIHECFHVGAGIATGGEITKIEVDTKAGGDTDMNGGIPCLTLPAGPSSFPARLELPLVQHVLHSNL